MSNAHAMRFPFVGSAMLMSLFLLFKFLSKDLVNAVLTCYFFVLGIVALSYVLLFGLNIFLLILLMHISSARSSCFFFLFMQGNIFTIYKTFSTKALEWGCYHLAFSIFSQYVITFATLIILLRIVFFFRTVQIELYFGQRGKNSHRNFQNGQLWHS